MFHLLTVTARDGKTSYQVDSSKGAGLSAIPLRPRILASPPPALSKTTTGGGFGLSIKQLSHFCHDRYCKIAI